jgi:hypothetical protein
VLTATASPTWSGRRDAVRRDDADHRHASVLRPSIADLVMDIQRIKTALIRQLLDNVYLANNQRMEVSESACRTSARLTTCW